MKLEVGMYVRSHNIFKIGHPIVLMKLNKMLEEDDLKIKASHNLIDLIEVGDYVNGYKIREVDKFDIYTFYMSDDPLKQEDIKSIVTREQFVAMQYVVGGVER